MRARSTRQHGFTLLEVMVVVAIFGILATLAAPSFTRVVHGSRVSEVARSLRAALADAQSRAIQSGVEHCLRIAGPDKRWEVQRDTDDDTLNGCEETLSGYEIPYDSVEFGPVEGFPEALPAPYEGAVPRDSWCTAAAADGDGDDEVCTLQFTSSGSIRDVVAAGTIVVQDTKTETTRVEGIMFIAPTGLVRMVRGAKE